MAASAWVQLVWARPGNGKSLDSAKTVLRLFRTYRYLGKRYPKLPQRALMSNLKLSSAIEKQHLGKDLFYWENPRQLQYCSRKPCFKSKVKHSLHDVDLVIDEISNYCPADGWRDLPRWLRKLFAQHRHRGIRIYANTQDYAMVDINFRRMVARAYRVTKIFGSRDISATLPPVRFVWGLILKRAFDPVHLEHEGVNSPKLESQGYPQIIWLTKKLIQVYDTTQDLPEWSPNSLEHIERKCLDPNCNKIHIEHRPV